MDRRRVEYDLDLQISPYAVYRRITDGEELALVHVCRESERPDGECPASLKAATRLPDGDWVPPSGVDVVVFDQDGEKALERVRALRAQGHERVWALFGGLDLWDLALGR